MPLALYYYLPENACAPFCYDPATNANVRTVVVDSIDPVVAIISFESNNPAPHFCSMKITQDVREYAAQKGLDEQAALEAGMKGKAEGFVATGAEVYVKA